MAKDSSNGKPVTGLRVRDNGDVSSSDAVKSYGMHQGCVAMVFYDMSGVDRFRERDKQIDFLWMASPQEHVIAPAFISK